MKRAEGTWRLPGIIRGLRRARWGKLDGRKWHGVRSLLTALVDLAEQQKATSSGHVTTTAWQLAGATGYSEKWVRDCLHELEYAGVVRWYRGDVGNRRLGQPDPSLITIQRKPLMALLNHARGEASEKERIHALDVARRLLKIRSGRVKSKPSRFRNVDQPELSGSLPPHGEASTGRTPPGGHEQPTLLATMTHAMHEIARTTAPPAPSPDDTGPPDYGGDYLTQIRATALANARKFAHA